MFSLSTSVAVCNYFIPSTLGVVLFSVSMGFLLSLDLSQVHTLCRRPNTTFRNHVLHREVSQLSPPSSFGWTLGSRELLLHLILLLVAMAEGGLLHHFTGPVQSLLQAPISYLLLAIFCVCWAIREIQEAYVFGGIFLNPFYPRGMSNVQTFKQKSKGLYIAAAFRRILLYLGK